MAITGFITNRGRYRINKGYFVREGLPPTMRMILCTKDAVPTVDTHTVSELVEMASGNGYATGGVVLVPGVDFFGATEDDVNDRSDVIVQDVAWNATGDMPPAGNGARYACLVCDGDSPSRDVVAVWDLGADYVKIAGESLILAAFAVRLNLPAA